jgi:hypothetical protein
MDTPQKIDRQRSGLAGARLRGSRATSGPAAAQGDGVRANPLREAVQG